MPQGKLIVIEGLDGSGKATQASLLADFLQQCNIPVREISFPCYSQPSSVLVKMYLQGEFGDSPDAVGPYAASTFYAVDRYASFKKDWGSFYQQGGIIVANRYVTSNLVHQMTKLPKDEWSYFMEWLRDLEYDKFQVPVPDLVVFLDMPVAVSQKLLLGRYQGDEMKKDIHEKDIAYLKQCYEAARFAAEKDNWHVIACSDGSEPLSVDAIAGQIQGLIKEHLI